MIPLSFPYLASLFTSTLEVDLVSYKNQTLSSRHLILPFLPGLSVKLIKKEREINNKVGSHNSSGYLTAGMKLTSN